MSPLTANPSTDETASERLLATGGANGALRNLLWATTAGAAFFGPLDISADGATMTVGLDPYVLMKLVTFGIATLLAAYGLVTSPDVRSICQSLPAMLILAILFLVTLAGPTAISGASIPTTLINIGFLCFVATALVGIGIEGMVTAALAGALLSTALAWLLFLFFPRYGVFPEQLAGGLIVERMGGVAHPNSFSRSVLLAALFLFYLFRVDRISLRMAVLLALPCLLAAWLAWSRTAIIAGGLAVFVLSFDRFRGRLGTSLMVGGVMAGMLIVTLLFAMGKEDHMIDLVLSKISKSGDAEEITSGTGRSEIWSYAIHLISERPIIGHGFNAAPIMMINHSQSTHNAVLHASLAGGIFAGALMVCILTWNLITAVRTNNVLIKAMTTFLIISCLMEETVLETFPGPCTMCWLICSLYPVLSHVGHSQSLANTMTPTEHATTSLA